MEIDNDLIQQWEPKIQKKLNNPKTFVIGMDRDDIAQELRIAIVKAAKSFDEDRGVKFHTYLHTTMERTMATLITRAVKQPEVKSLDIIVAGQEGFLVPFDILEALRDPHAFEDDVETDALIYDNGLSDQEQLFIELRRKGYTMDRITKELNESAYKVRQSLREKFSDLADEYEIDH